MEQQIFPYACVNLYLPRARLTAACEINGVLALSSESFDHHELIFSDLTLNV